MIAAHPSQQLQDFTHYALAWFVIVALLVGLGYYSGRAAVGVAVGILIAAGLVLVGNGTIKGPSQHG